MPRISLLYVIMYNVYYVMTRLLNCRAESCICPSPRILKQYHQISGNFTSGIFRRQKRRNGPADVNKLPAWQSSRFVCFPLLIDLQPRHGYKLMDCFVYGCKVNAIDRKRLEIVWEHGFKLL